MGVGWSLTGLSAITRGNPTIFHNQAMARAVRDQLEQALYSLPRHDGRAQAIALQIEESIEVALEIELRGNQRDHPGWRSRSEPQ